MKNDVYFDKWYHMGRWPTLEELKPYFIAPKGKEWFYTGGNDSGSLSIEGVNGAQHTDSGQTHFNVRLSM